MSRVQMLLEMCRFRNNHPAFDGMFELLDTLTDLRDAVAVINTPLLKQTGSDLPKIEEESESGFLEEVCGISFNIRDSSRDWYDLPY
jgi:hypothetical protein